VGILQSCHVAESSTTPRDLPGKVAVDRPNGCML
jgi:hypothetical protein